MNLIPFVSTHFTVQKDGRVNTTIGKSYKITKWRPHAPQNSVVFLTFFDDVEVLRYWGEYDMEKAGVVDGSYEENLKKILE